MTTLASPSQGGSERLSLWRVEMPAGSAGPLHYFNSEQLWTVVEGKISISCEGATVEAGPGDTAVIAAHIQRQITALEDVNAIVCGFADAIAMVPGEKAPRGTPAWIA